MSPDETENPPLSITDRSDGEIASPDEIMEGVEGIELSPSEHQRIKDLVNGRELKCIKGHERRYLVAGAGGETGAATRREIVYDLLDNRDDPPAVATQLEDFGLSPEEIRLWVRVFDILCGMATHIVAVIEDFEGGYVWELGLLFADEYRQKTWVLKRQYTDADVEREKYDNGMGASHVKLLLTGSQAFEWTDVEELKELVITRVP